MKPDSLFIDTGQRFAVGYYARTPEGFGHHSPVPVEDWEGVKKGMTLRVVYSLDDMEEKIAILESGLDDIVVERLKFSLVSVPDIRKTIGDSRLRFHKRQHTPEWIDDVVQGGISFVYRAPDTGEITSAFTPMTLYYDMLLCCSKDVRMFPENDNMAVNIDAEWIANVMKSDPGCSMPYYRKEKPFDDGSFRTAVTFRRTENNPTLRLYGLGKPDGTIQYPPLFLDLHPMINGTYTAYLGITPYIINPFGGLQDVFQRHLPPEPIIDYEDYINRLTDWIFHDIHFFHRDTYTRLDIDSLYKTGDFIRGGFFIETTSTLDKPSPQSNIRFLIMSSCAVPIYNLKGLGDNNPQLAMWGMNVLHYNSVFKIMDIFHTGEITQVTLLQVPPSAALIVNDEKGWAFLNSVAANFEEFNGMTVVEKAHSDFMDNFEKEVHPLSYLKEWTVRTGQLIGVTPEGSLYSLAPLTATKENGIENFSNILMEYNNKPDDIIPKYTLSLRTIDSTDLTDSE